APTLAVPVRSRPWLRLVPDDGAAGPAFVQGSLRLVYPLPTGLESEPAAAKAKARQASRPMTSETAAPSPHGWASRFLQAVVEVVASERPLTQLARWTSPGVYAQIR